MLERLKRPGYWIVLFAVMTVYFYHAYQKQQERERREALFRTYQSYAREIMDQLSDGNFSDLQGRFDSRPDREVSLEDIAMFMTTLHMDRIPEPRWKKWEESNGTVTLHGELGADAERRYPVDMVMVKQGGRTLLKKLRIGSQVLQLKPSTVPFELNVSTR